VTAFDDRADLADVCEALRTYQKNHDTPPEGADGQRYERMADVCESLWSCKAEDNFYPEGRNDQKMNRMARVDEIIGDYNESGRQFARVTTPADPEWVL
jgi:hypothetical protein